MKIFLVSFLFLSVAVVRSAVFASPTKTEFSPQILKEIETNGFEIFSAYLKWKESLPPGSDDRFSVYVEKLQSEKQQREFFEAPEQKEFFEAPEQKEFFEAPEQKEYFKAPEQREFFEAPEQKEFFKAPEQREFFEAPEQKEYFKAPEQREFLEAPEPKEFFEAPEQKDFFKAPEQREFFEAPEQRESVEEPSPEAAGIQDDTQLTDNRQLRGPYDWEGDIAEIND